MCVFTAPRGPAARSRQQTNAHTNTQADGTAREHSLLCAVPPLLGGEPFKADRMPLCTRTNVHKIAMVSIAHTLAQTHRRTDAQSPGKGN